MYTLNLQTGDDSLQEIYNILAGSIRTIRDNMNDGELQKFNDIASSVIIDYKKHISKAVHKLFDDELNSRILMLSDLAEIEIPLISFMDKCNKEHEYELMLMTVRSVDSSLYRILRNERNKAFSMGERLPLNNNYDEYGIKLFPRVTCDWERKSRGRNTNIRLDNYLDNLLMIDYKSVKENYKDKHFFIETKLDFNNKYTFVTVPYSNQWNQKINYINDKKYNLMHIEYTGNKDKDTKLVEEKMIQASGRSVLIFPEVHGYKGQDKKISEYLLAESIEQLPLITVLPSYWNDRKNAVSILDEFGEIISSQIKYIPYEMEYKGVNYIEDLEIIDKELSIIHCEGMGRIAVLICRDFLERNYIRDIISLYKLTMIIVPSFSTGSYDFLENAEICNDLNCCVLWVNSCAAYSDDRKDNFKTISFFTKPKVRNIVGVNSDNEYKKEPCEDISSCNECDKECMFEYQIQVEK